MWKPIQFQPQVELATETTPSNNISAADEDAFGFTRRGEGGVDDGNRKLTQGHLIVTSGIDCVQDY